MKMLSTRVAAILALLLILPAATYAHCEIPCGIYDDQARFDLLSEHITTIEKSMKQVTELSAAGDKNYNQLVRWINNKELHANKFQEIVTQYFMTQRIKPANQADSEAYSKYTKEVTLLHQMLVEAMKCKQTTDLSHIENLRQLLAKFHDLYHTDHGK